MLPECSAVAGGLCLFENHPLKIAYSSYVSCKLREVWRGPMGVDSCVSLERGTWHFCEKSNLTGWPMVCLLSKHLNYLSINCCNTVCNSRSHYFYSTGLHNTQCEILCNCQIVCENCKLFWRIKWIDELAMTGKSWFLSSCRLNCKR